MKRESIMPAYHDLEGATFLGQTKLGSGSDADSHIAAGVRAIRGIGRELRDEISRGFGDWFRLHRHLDLCNVDLRAGGVSSGILVLISKESRNSSVTLSESPFYKESVGRPLCFRERSPKMRSR
jgi:hypothetical protein